MLFTFASAQSEKQMSILDQFVTMHATGTEEAIEQFIQSTYLPDYYQKINLKEHVKFYDQILQEFGPLNPMIYKTIEEKPNRLVVHLIKADENIQNQNINPNEILVVKIDLSTKNPNYMDRSLGLGSLVCERKK